MVKYHSVFGQKRPRWQRQGPLAVNNYLLIDEENKVAVLIDSTEENLQINETLKQYGAKLKSILLTHGHFDHILGVNVTQEDENFMSDLLEDSDSQVKTFVHKDDLIMIENVERFMMGFAAGKVEPPIVENFVNDGDVINVGDMEIKVIHTPGHSKGSVSYLSDGNLFSGDTLFLESVGRTDLYGGDYNELVKSVKEKLFTLDDNTKVYPGHGPMTTIAHEKANNMFL